MEAHVSRVNHILMPRTNRDARWNAAPRIGLRVACYTDPQALLNPGGGEVQSHKTAAHLRRLGVDARTVCEAGADITEYDWVHLFGTTPASLEMARRAKVIGTRIALSTISWYDPWVNWKLEHTSWRKLRGMAGWMLRRTLPSVPSWRRDLLRLCDLLLPNSDVEARQLVELFGVPESRIEVVPNGVDEQFARGDAALFERHFGLRDFVLIPGRIEP